MFDPTARFKHDFLHLRMQAPAFVRTTHLGIFVNQCVQANQTQDVHRNRCQSAGQDIGVKSTTGKTLKIHVGLELGMALLVRGVVVVQPN